MSKTKAYMPKITLCCFTSSSGITQSFDNLKSSVAFEQVSFEQSTGSLLEAIEYFVNNPAPDLLVIEENESGNTLELLENLARVLSGETELILIGEKDNILTYKSMKSLGVFEYLLNNVTEDELLLTLQQAAVKVRSGKVGTVVAFVPVCSPNAFEDIIFNMLKVVQFNDKKPCIVLDLNIGYGNSDLIFQMDESNALLELFEKRNFGKIDLQQACRTIIPGLDLISHSNDFSVYVDDHLERIATLINMLRELYDHVLVLLPNGWQKVHAHSILRSDKLVLVSEDYLSSYRDVIRVALFLNSIGITMQEGSLIINSMRNDARGKAVIREVSDTLGGLKPKVVHSLPRVREDIEMQKDFRIDRTLTNTQVNILRQLAEELGLEITDKINSTLFKKMLKKLLRG